MAYHFHDCLVLIQSSHNMKLGNGHMVVSVLEKMLKFKTSFFEASLNQLDY